MLRWLGCAVSAAQGSTRSDVSSSTSLTGRRSSDPSRTSWENANATLSMNPSTSSASDFDGSMDANCRWCRWAIFDVGFAGQNRTAWPWHADVRSASDNRLIPQPAQSLERAKTGPLENANINFLQIIKHRIHVNGFGWLEFVIHFPFFLANRWWAYSH